MISRNNTVIAAMLTLTAIPALPLHGQEGEAETPQEAASIELKDPVAVVNGRNISSAELKQSVSAQLARAGRTIDQVPGEMLLAGYHRVLEDMIIDVILEEKSKDIEVEDAAVEENFARLVSQVGSEEKLKEALAQSDETVETVKESIRTNLRKREWITSRIETEPEVAEAEIEGFYNENPDNFQQEEQVRASHILLMTPDDLSEEEVAEKKRALEAIAKKLEEGADFAELAKEHSEDPGSKEKGGDLDYFTRERMVPEFAEAAFSLKPGEVSDIVKTQFGYHLVKVTDKKEARTIPLEESKERIEGFLKEQKQQKALDQLLTALKQQSDVKNNLPPLPSQQEVGE